MGARYVDALGSFQTLKGAVHAGFRKHIYCLKNSIGSSAVIFHLLPCRSIVHFRI
jgi:hypothetical protein